MSSMVSKLAGLSAGRLGITYPDNPSRVFDTPDPDARLAVLIPQTVQVFRRKASPGIVRTREELKPLHVVAFFHKGS